MAAIHFSLKLVYFFLLSALVVLFMSGRKIKFYSVVRFEFFFTFELCRVFANGKKPTTVIALLRYIAMCTETFAIRLSSNDVGIFRLHSLNCDHIL